MSFWDIALKFSDDLLYGLSVTLRLNLVIWSVGIGIGTLLGIASVRWPSTIGLITRVFSLVFIGVPFLVLLFWMHYPLQVLLGVVWDPFFTAALTLSSINVLLVADLVRGVLKDFPKQYLLVGRLAGLSSWKIAWEIQLPIALRQILPSLLLVQIVMLHGSLFASVISVEEVFRVAQRINSRIYRPVEIYSLLAIFFLMATLPLYGLASWMRRKFTRDLSEG